MAIAFRKIRFLLQQVFQSSECFKTTNATAFSCCSLSNPWNNIAMLHFILRKYSNFAIGPTSIELPCLLLSKRLNTGLSKEAGKASWAVLTFQLNSLFHIDQEEMSKWKPCPCVFERCPLSHSLCQNHLIYTLWGWWQFDNSSVGLTIVADVAIATGPVALGGPAVFCVKFLFIICKGWY